MFLCSKIHIITGGQGIKIKVKHLTWDNRGISKCFENIKREISLELRKDFIGGLTFELGIGKSRGYERKKESGVTQRATDTCRMFMEMQLLFVGVWSKNTGVQELELKKTNK